MTSSHEHKPIRSLNSPDKHNTNTSLTQCRLVSAKKVQKGNSAWGRKQFEWVCIYSQRGGTKHKGGEVIRLDYGAGTCQSTIICKTEPKDNWNIDNVLKSLRGVVK